MIDSTAVRKQTRDYTTGQIRDFAFWVSEHKGSLRKGKYLKGNFISQYVDKKIDIIEEGGRRCRSVTIHIYMGTGVRKLVFRSSAGPAKEDDFYRPGHWGEYLMRMCLDPNGVPIDDRNVFA